ncbi:MAG: peptidylprolyl isomerase [candidate division Zixibacteria bacterium]|nr:peptidylprolyl isomerase [candidate division Zixibacteria bacterium]
MKKVLILSVLLVFFLFGCGKQEEPKGEAPQEQPEQVAEAEEEMTKPITQEAIEREKNPVVVVETNFGPIELELFWDKTPKTAENFLRLVISEFYDSLTFHRVVPDFVIQGGDPLGTGTGGPGYTIDFEKADTKHLRGSLGMARSQDLNSGGSQFYICLKALPNLDGNYVVFGKVVKGMDVVDKIAQVKTDDRDMPLEKVIMTKVYEKTE